MSMPRPLPRSRRRTRSDCYGSHCATTTTTSAATVPRQLRLLFLLISFITAPRPQQPLVSAVAAEAAFVSTAAATTSTRSHSPFSFCSPHGRSFIPSFKSRRRRFHPEPTIARSSFSPCFSSTQQQELDTTSTSTTTTVVVVVPDDLTSLTVKELRELVKQQNSQERGLLSRLKRKQDLISYLLQRHDEHDDDDDDDKVEIERVFEEQDNHDNGSSSSNGEYVASVTPSTSSSSSSQQEAIMDEALQIPQQPLHNGVAAAAATADTSRRRKSTTNKKLPLNMPAIRPLPVVVEEDDEEEQQQPPSVDDSSTTRTTRTTMSPKDAIFERVYQRYPPLRQAAADATITTAAATAAMASSPTFSSSSSSQFYSVTEDMRQWYHPVFSNLWTRTSSTTPATATTTTQEQERSNDTDSSCTTAAISSSSSNGQVNGSSNFSLVSSDMDVVFVGTASCTPGVTRGVSCTALRLNWRRKSAIYRNGHMEQIDNFQGGTWLFDVGECTQLQVQRTPSIRPSKITKIFLTHAHGDHSFGLPGLLCLMGRQEQREDSPPVEIYGPEGLRMWLRVAIRYSVSRICPPYRVHEIMNVPMAPEWDFSQRTRRFYYKGIQGRGRRHPQQHGRAGPTTTSSWANPRGLAGEDPINWISQANNMQLEASPLYGEIEGGRQIHPIYNHPLSSDGAPVWEVEDEEDVKVYAAPMSHGIPCLGYVVEELPRPGRLRNDVVEPIVKRNVKALKQAGFPIPMKAMAVIKNLPPGSAFTFPDGTVVTQEEAVEPPRRGRKVVICGDTCDSRALDKLAQDATVVIHEATNTFLQGVDNKDANVHDVTRDAITHGHSTPQIAGQFARRVNAGLLVLNHFSARYKGDISVDSLSIMMRIEQQAMKVSALNETQVVAAWDLMVLPIPQL